jgi:sigma-B regulation protein RsbU (phosphoserine phosphatase)
VSRTANGKAALQLARILVVDDLEENRDLLIRRLRREGYHDIAVAVDGEEALAQLRAKSFDLVLLDVMMPKCDGYQVLEQLKAENRLHELPVIVISALDEIDSVVRCIQLGAVDYLPKPFNATILRARVSASLEQKFLRDVLRAHMARMEEELVAARRLQMSMVPAIFPKPTVDQPVEIFAMMEPAREVGGDLYDFFTTEDGRFAFAIADVCGKGVPAAMLMARTKNLLRVVTGFLQGSDHVDRAAEIVARVNRELCDDNDMMMFVTLIFGMMEPETGTVELCNAGHEPPYRLNGTGAVALAAPQGMALGINAACHYESTRFELLPNETLYLFTDGITEATNPQSALFSRERLEATLGAHATAPLERLIREVTEAAQNFAGEAPQADDITSLAIRRLMKESCPRS